MTTSEFKVLSPYGTGRKNNFEFVYTSDKDDEIVRHEKIMLEKYLKILDSYRVIFEQYNCSLKVGCSWTNFLKKNIQNIACLLKMGISVIFIAKYRKMVKKYI